MAAPVDGQRLQKAGKLLAARDKFASCARRTCPAEIVSDCTRWVGEVEAALPSIALAARDQAGRDLGDVTVSIDGKPAEPMSARSTLLDPGSHKFVFKRAPSAAPAGGPAGGAASVVEQTTILREGEKNREVVAVFRVPGAAVAPPVVQERPVPAAAWVSAGFGVAGFAVLGIAGGIGVSNRASEHCDVGCAQSQKSGVDNLFHVADVGLGVGVVGVVLATVLILARPTVERPAASRPGEGKAASAKGVRDGLSGSALIDVLPLPGGGAATLGGRF